MIYKISIPLLLLLLGYFVISEENVKIIFSGVAIFIIGMNFMEEGFKLFSGKFLENILEKFTNKLPKAIFTGFISSTLVQSSSLVSIIVISFLSVKLISLSQAIGVVFGANLGSTTTAWLVSLFGLKLNIASYAMPLIIFGVIFKYFNLRAYKGIGNALVGLGFIFLAIYYLKDGFDNLKNTIDLSTYYVQSFWGIIIYVLVGSLATIVIQSSGATMAIIITALASNQISYESALALTIGANIGTTFTAILASFASNENGKRLAFAHLIFNITTAFITIIFLKQIEGFVDLISEYFLISEDNYIIKLSIFHTIFNLLGIFLVSPFIPKIEKLSKRIIKNKYKSQSKPKYIDNSLIDVPISSIKAIEKELDNMYEKSLKTILHAISLHRKEVFSKKSLSKTVKKSTKNFNINIDRIYHDNIEHLYNEIILFSTLAQEHMNEIQVHRVFKLKLAAKEIIDTLQEVKRIQLNISHFSRSKNSFIKDEYNLLRKELANTLKEISLLKNKKKDLDISSKIEVLQQRIKDLDIINNNKIDSLIRESKIDSKMASSLINDSSTTNHICKKLLRISNTLLVKDAELQLLGEEHGY